MKNGYFIGNIPYFQTNPYNYCYYLQCGHYVWHIWDVCYDAPRCKFLYFVNVIECYTLIRCSKCAFCLLGSVDIALVSFEIRALLIPVNGFFHPVQCCQEALILTNRHIITRLGKKTQNLIISGMKVTIFPIPISIYFILFCPISSPKIPGTFHLISYIYFVPSVTFFQSPFCFIQVFFYKKPRTGPIRARATFYEHDDLPIWPVTWLKTNLYFEMSGTLKFP